MPNWVTTHCPLLSVVFGVFALAGFYAVSQYNYLLFHSLVEVLAAIVAVAVFMLFWNARRFMGNSFFLFIGIACLFTGILDLMHVLTYRGTSVFPGMNGDESIQLKTAGRWIAGLSFLVAPLFLRRRVKPLVILFAYSTVFLLVCCLVFCKVLPAFYTPEKGMTVSEHIGRCVSCVLFLTTAGLIAAKRRELDARVFRLLFAALLVSAVSEFTSAVSSDFYGLLKVVAHLSEVVAYYLIYKAFVVEGLTNPLSVFFKNQQESERKYRGLFERSRDALMTIEPPSWTFTAANPATAEMFRLKNAEESTTVGPLTLSPERQPDGRDSAEKAREMIATALREGSHFFEWTHKRIDGEEFPATVLLTTMEEAGKLVVLATVRDVTEQKRAETVVRQHAAALRREYDGLQAVFDAAQVGFLLVNERIEVVRVNEMLAAIIGRSTADMLGRRPGDGMCCLHAVMSPQGCGTSEACCACPIRGSIARALQLGENSRGLEVSHTLQVRRQRQRLLVPGQRHTRFNQRRSSCPIGDHRHQRSQASRGPNPPLRD